uniref:AlNc14C352G10918 protein n=1 Tax=Albugo laibachii Nc14 TaxID=890382 RepID=F0WXG7_9STRA|nr:AlNc14C352G10918 [Albugo laibachii Nc14]|eukprot:CCA26160.1 AlNc14C352G10918 [Albugo laibachii Nc14]
MSTWEEEIAERVLIQGMQKQAVQFQRVVERTRCAAGYPGATHSRSRVREYRPIGERVVPTCHALQRNPTIPRDNDGSTWSESFRPNDREVYPRSNVVNHQNLLMGVEEFERSQNSMVFNHIAPSDVGFLSADVGFRQVTTRSDPIRAMSKISSFYLRCKESEKRLDQYRNIFDDLESQVASLEARNSAMEAVLASMKQSHKRFCAIPSVSFGIWNGVGVTTEEVQGSAP